MSVNFCKQMAWPKVRVTIPSPIYVLLLQYRVDYVIISFKYVLISHPKQSVIFVRTTQENSNKDPE